MTLSAKAKLVALYFSSDIKRLTQDFSGREWLLKEVDAWLKRKGERFFILTGEPGVGKSAFAAWLTRTRKDIAAYNFCIDGRNDTIVPNTVLRSLGAQLGHYLPDYGKALANTIKPERVSIDVKINVEKMTGGEITGVIINHLHASDPKEVLDIILRAPLAALPKATKPVIILIDSLDEAITYRKDLNLVTLLSGLDDLPPWVRIFCTSRPERSALCYFDGLSPHILAAESKMNLKDVEQYITKRVGRKTMQVRINSAGKTPEDLTTKLKDKDLHKGNFLFVKILLDDIEAGRQSLEDLNALPKSIDEIYHGFLTRFKAQWQKRYQPILGILAVAREPVSETQLANFTGIKRTTMRQSLGEIIQFLDEHGDGGTGKTYTLYHQSFRDYLLDEKRNVDFWCAREDGHQSIADYYLKKFSKQWSNCDDYGLRHLPEHLAGPDQTNTLQGLLFTFDWLQAKLERTDANALIADYELFPVDHDLRLVQGAIRLSTHVIAQDNAQLPSQLVGRLSSFKSVGFQNLVDSAKKWRGKSWLCPLIPSLDAPGGPLLRTLKGRPEGHAGTVRSLAITPDGRSAISAGNSNTDQTVRIWDLETGKCRYTFPNQAALGGYTPLALAAAGNLAVSVYEGEIRIWDLTIGKLRHTIPVGKVGISAVALIEGSNRIIAGLTDGSLCLCDIEQRTVVELPGHPDGINALAVTPDGRRAFSVSDSLIKAWDLDTSREFNMLQGLTGLGGGLWGACAIAVSSDGRQLIYGDPLRIWDPDQHSSVQMSLEGISGNIVAVTADGLRAIIKLNDQTLAVWDLAARKKILDLPHGSSTVATLSMTPDGTHLITADDDHDLRVWDLSASARPAAMPIGHELEFINFDVNGKQAVFKALDGTFRVFDLDGAAFIPESAATTLAIQDALSSAKHKASVKASVRTKLQRALEAVKKQLPDWVLQKSKFIVATSIDGSRAITAVYPIGKPGDFEEPERTAVQDDRTEKSLGDLYLWDIGDTTTSRVMKGHTSDVTTIDISSDGNWAISGCSGRLLRVWNLGDGIEKWVLRGHGGIVSSVSISSDGSLAASASEDSTVRVWNLELGKPIATFTGEGWMDMCQVSSDGTALVAQESSGRLHILKLHRKVDA